MRFAGIATLAVMLAGTAVAQQAGKPAADEGKPITRLAISDKLNSDYADLDADKDGKATPEEINARLVRTAEADLAVIRKARDDAFAKLDTDANGSISKAEFDAKAALPTIKEPKAEPFLERFDANKDGTISQDEFRAPTLANFERLDKNKDGTLSLAEQNAGSATAAAAGQKKPAVKKTPVISR